MSNISELLLDDPLKPWRVVRSAKCWHFTR